MTPYSIALYFHFLGLIGLFVGYGLEWTASSLLRRSTSAEQARAWLRIYRFSLPISGPGLLVLIVSGGYLASVTGAMKQGGISAALANDPRLAARGKRGAAGNGAGASAGPDGRDARSRAVCAGARDRLPDDGQTAVACDGIIYPARRDCHRAAVCGVCLEVAAGRREDVNPRIISRGTVLTWTECPLGKAPLHNLVLSAATLDKSTQEKGRDFSHPLVDLW